MIIVKGTRVIFDLLGEDRSLHAPARAGLLHDPSGRDWPRCSALVGPYARTAEPLEDAKAQQYFGRSYQVRAARVTLPPRPIASWRSVGPVERIWYTRGGTKYPGPFQHKFNKGWIPLVFGKKRVILYKLGSWCRLEFPDGCTLDDRGFVRP